MTEMVGVVEGPYYGCVLVCMPYWKIINDTMSEIITAQYITFGFTNRMEQPQCNNRNW